MGRIKTTPPTLPGDEIVDTAAIGRDMALMREQGLSRIEGQANADAYVRAVALKVGYALPADAADPNLIQRDIAANMRRSVEACLEVGRGLTVLKAACGHGNFVARLDVLGMDTRVAQRFMQSATKFSNAASTPLLTAIGSQTKLFEMLVLDDEQLEELELTGQTGELKLDDVATMSVKELRAALREERKERKAVDEVSAEKSKRIDELKTRAKRIQAAPPDEALQELIKEASTHLHDALGCLRGNLRAAMEALAKHYITHGGDQLTVHMAGMVGQLQADLNALRSQFNLPDVAESAVPEWVRLAEAEAAAKQH
ncbi:hypothetical protein [Ideonella sp.]|uniref:hypothetical protein n=1 Tax=Ideonella sp. TaxID=1929293 RepID=UPI003BB52006